MVLDQNLQSGCTTRWSDSVGLLVRCFFLALQRRRQQRRVLVVVRGGGSVLDAEVAEDATHGEREANQEAAENRSVPEHRLVGQKGRAVRTGRDRKQKVN